MGIDDGRIWGVTIRGNMSRKGLDFGFISLD